VRLATFNLLSGRSLRDGRVDTDRLQRAVADLDADVLALQEVDRDQPRSHAADLTAIAAEALGAVAHRFVPTMAGSPDAWRPAGTTTAGPLYGISLLSRLPVLRWEVLRLEPAPVSLPLPVGPRQVALVRDEPRAAVVAVLESRFGEVAVACTHLSFVPGWNRRQLRQVARFVGSHDGPVALLGDLNLGARAAARASGLISLVTAPTYPSPRPVRQLDHVLARGLSSSGGRAVELPLSDHRALVVEVGPVG
jgi:endonuclease/exonuclease/phosphatase family metal-dependent hydrolase